ncbi:DUF2688 domain-containing protein [Neobacillus niacini]|uniref:DUF2688 domain-containing protein n=1 Tax=Neobacillus niacini TaxID=86668 RepID=UPI003B58B2B1
MTYPPKVTTLCKYCGKEIRVTRRDVLTVKDLKVILGSCCIKCKAKRIFQLKWGQ